MILAGLVFSGERKIDKAGQALADDAPLEVRGKDHPWVSRGGIKLAHGLDHFGWDVTGAVALDVGSSTGGFTDVLLQKGAAKVFAVDVGTNQLAWKLRQDPRVIVHEQTNARYLTDDDRHRAGRHHRLRRELHRLAKVLDTALDFAKPGGRLIALVKPQFEAERDEIGKGGVVRDPAVHERVCAAAAAWLASARLARRGGDAKPDHRARGQCRVPDRGPERRGGRDSLIHDLIQASLDKGGNLGIERCHAESPALPPRSRRGARGLRRRRRQGAREAAASGQGRGGDAR